MQRKRSELAPIAEAFSDLSLTIEWRPRYAAFGGDAPGPRQVTFAGTQSDVCRNLLPHKSFVYTT